jgi:hypothetical protein
VRCNGTKSRSNLTSTLPTSSGRLLAAARSSCMRMNAPASRSTLVTNAALCGVSALSLRDRRTLSNSARTRWSRVRKAASFEMT